MSGVEGRTGGAGWSAAAKARAVREAGRGGRVRRALAVVGLDPLVSRARVAERVAARWEAGARGEELTAGLLAPLARKGWAGFYDRALPGRSRANFDHVLVPPAGDLLVLVDSKLWSARWPVRRSDDGRLMHGTQDREGAVRALRYERDVLARELAGAGCPVEVVPVIVVHNARVTAGRFRLGDITVVEAAGLLPVLRGWTGVPDGVAFGRLAAAAGKVLPRYEESGR